MHKTLNNCSGMKQTQYFIEWNYGEAILKHLFQNSFKTLVFVWWRVSCCESCVSDGVYTSQNSNSRLKFSCSSPSPVLQTRPNFIVHYPKKLFVTHLIPCKNTTMRVWCISTFWGFLNSFLVILWWYVRICVWVKSVTPKHYFELKFGRHGYWLPSNEQRRFIQKFFFFGRN